MTCNHLRLLLECQLSPSASNLICLLFVRRVSSFHKLGQSTTQSFFMKFAEIKALADPQELLVLLLNQDL